MKYYLITNKEDDFGNKSMAVYYGEEKNIKDYVYNYKKIPKTHYEVLRKYCEDINEIIDEEWYIDFDYKSIEKYLEENYG